MYALFSVISRRSVLMAAPVLAVAAATRPAFSSSPIGAAIEIEGSVTVQRTAGTEDLAADAAIMLDDLVVTGGNSFAQLLLKSDTHISLGGDTQLLIDQFVIDQGGTLQLGGAMVFDRPDGASSQDVTVRTAFAMIGVRGTKFFAGPSNDVYGVFCEHGEVEVLAQGVKRVLKAGDGCDIAKVGAAPSEIKQWGASRIAAAYASVGL